MRLLSEKYEKDGEGTLMIVPQVAEDMWHLYNLVAIGDTVASTTLRKVKSESSTGSVDSKKIRTVLSLKVRTIDFDAETCQMRIGGRTTSGNNFVSAGQHHTLDLELNQKFSITKDRWDFVLLERIDNACNAAKSADVAALIMEPGLAHVCLVTSNMTQVQHKIEVNVPRKGKDRIGAQHEKGMAKFFGKIIESVKTSINFDVVKCVLVCSAGGLKEQFYNAMVKDAQQTDCKAIFKNLSKFLLVSVSSGHKHALNEALANPAIVEKLSDTKAAGEVKALNVFFKTLDRDSDRAFYGFNHVAKANAVNAIETLLVSDKLFRSANVSTRNKYVELVESATDNGADLKIFSSLHASGERLDNLSGIAAVLRFPVPEIEGEEDDSDESDDEA